MKPINMTKQKYNNKMKNVKNLEINNNYTNNSNIKNSIQNNEFKNNSVSNAIKITNQKFKSSKNSRKSLN